MKQDDKKIEKFIELSFKKKLLKKEYNEVASELGALEGELVDYFVQTGTKKITRQGMTVYLHTQLWAKKKEGVTNAEAVGALEDAGLGEYTSFNSASLSSLMREWAEMGHVIPEQVNRVIEGSMSTSIRSRKAGASNG